jgi:hypothetical protein
MGVVIKSLRDSARGEQCTVRLGGICNHDPATTVLAHARDAYTGFATKANDWSAFFCCSACHEDIDRHRLDPARETRAMYRAMQRTQARWYELGLMTFPETPKPPAKPLNKTVPRPAKFRR